jgi:hypothetical protein
VAALALQGRELRCRKRGRDGSAKCDLAPRPDRVAFGVVYAMDPGERPALDRAEGLGHGYREQGLLVPGLGPVFCYVADPAYLDETLRPFPWYRAYVLEGARHFGFPASYRARVAAWETVPDPDPERAAAQARLLAALPATGPRPLELTVVRFPEPGQG